MSSFCLVAERNECDKMMGNIKENINEEAMIMEKKLGGMGKANTPGPVLGNVSSNQMRDKAGSAGVRKKDDKKKWLKRI